MLGSLVRELGGGLCGDEGGFETLPAPSEEDGDGERSGAAEEPRRRDGVAVAAEEVLGAPASTIFLRGILSLRTPIPLRDAICKKIHPPDDAVIERTAVALNTRGVVIWSLYRRRAAESLV